MKRNLKEKFRLPRKLAKVCAECIVVSLLMTMALHANGLQAEMIGIHAPSSAQSEVSDEAIENPETLQEEVEEGPKDEAGIEEVLKEEAELETEDGLKDEAGLENIEVLKDEVGLKDGEGLEGEEGMEVEEPPSEEPADREEPAPIPVPTPLVYGTPSLSIEAADGNNAYYRSKPDISLHYNSAQGEMHYRLLLPSGKELNGLVQEATPLLLPGKYLEEGKNRFSAWLMGEGQEQWRNDSELLVDSIAPSTPAISYSKALEDGQLRSNSGISLSFQASDQGSGVVGYEVTFANGSKSFCDGKEGNYTISSPYQGSVKVCAIDVAGNRSQISESASICVDQVAPSLEVDVMGGFDTWHSEAPELHLLCEDTGVSAGLHSLKLWVNDKCVMEEGAESLVASPGVTVRNYMVTEIGAFNVKVVLFDFAGNEAVVERQLLYDPLPPNVTYLNAFNGMLIGDGRDVLLQINDDVAIAAYQLDLTCQAPTGASKTTTYSQVDLQQKQVSFAVPIHEEGRYNAALWVRDVSGKTTYHSLRFELDQSSPLIRKVEQLDGSSLPFFRWAYDQEDIVSDDNLTSEVLLLDNVPYERGETIVAEGAHLFEVKASDAVGNVGIARALFEIDHTAPVIEVANVEDGARLEHAVNLSLAVRGKGERISAVSINNEKIPIAKTQKFMEHFLKEQKHYKVEVKAIDLAGNESIKVISFQIKGKSDKGMNKEGDSLGTEQATLSNTGKMTRNVNNSGVSRKIGAKSSEDAYDQEEQMLLMKASAHANGEEISEEEMRMLFEAAEKMHDAPRGVAFVIVGFLISLGIGVVIAICGRKIRKQKKLP